MRATLFFSSVSFFLILFLILVLLVVVLMALRRERLYGAPPSGLIPFIVVVLGLCTFVALMSAYVRAKKGVEPQTISERMETARLEPLAPHSASAFRGAKSVADWLATSTSVR